MALSTSSATHSFVLGGEDPQRVGHPGREDLDLEPLLQGPHRTDGKQRPLPRVLSRILLAQGKDGGKVLG